MTTQPRRLTLNADAPMQPRHTKPRRHLVNEPHTELDPRFSDPNTEATSWQDAVDALEAAQLAWITTVRSDGRPHVTPLVAIWHNDAYYFATGPTEQKAVNLRHASAVAIATGRNAWDEGLDLVVEGNARRVTDQPTLERLADAWVKKWDGRWRYRADADGFRHANGEHGPIHVYEVRPVKILAFGKQPFTHTRHIPR
jgi:general stress protein 26